jgi:GTP-binding protein
MNAIFSHYGPFRGEIRRRQNGVMIAQDTCETVTFGLFNLQERGPLCCGAGEQVYAGQIIGIHAKSNDLVVNPGKRKQLTNMRASGSDDSLRLTTPRRFTLDAALEFINEDELVEVTPVSVRLRKRYLDHSERKKMEKIADARAAS